MDLPSLSFNLSRSSENCHPERSEGSLPLENALDMRFFAILRMTINFYLTPMLASVGTKQEEWQHLVLLFSVEILRGPLL